MKRYTRLLFTKWAQSVVGITISAVFIYFTLPSLHLPEVAQAMQSANYWWILPGVAVYFVGLWVRSWRWHYTLRRIKPVPSLRLFPLVCIGYFGNNGNMDQAITIRTIVFSGDEYSFQAGAGIVADSVPDNEYREVLAKSAILRKALELAEEGL